MNDIGCSWQGVMDEASTRFSAHGGCSTWAPAIQNWGTEKAIREEVNGSQLKLSSGKVWPLIPNAHHKPSLLECAQCSYSWARHKAQTLGPRCEEIESRMASKQQRKHGIWAPVKPTFEKGLHRFNRRHRASSKRKASTGWSDKIKCQRRCSCPETPQNGLKEHRLNRWKQSPSVGAVVQRDYKTNHTKHRLNWRWWTSIRRCNE